MSQYPSDPSDPFATPPASRGDMDFGDVQPPSSWPKVIGIISIVYGSLGIICNSCVSASPFVMPMLSELVKQGIVEQARQNGETIDPNSISLPPIFSFSPLILAAGLIGFGLSIFLIVAGAKLVRRAISARPMHLIWACGTLLAILLAGIHAAETYAALKTWAAANPDSPAAAQMNPASNLVQSACGLIIRLIYPVFILIWFGLVKRDTREITAGTPESTL